MKKLKEAITKRMGKGERVADHIRIWSWWWKID